METEGRNDGQPRLFGVTGILRKADALAAGNRSQPPSADHRKQHLPSARERVWLLLKAEHKFPRTERRRAALLQIEKVIRLRLCAAAGNWLRAMREDLTTGPGKSAFTGEMPLGLLFCDTYGAT